MRWAMCRRGLLLALFLCCLRAVPASWARSFENDPTAMLREADRARGNRGGVTWELTIDSREKGRESGMTVVVRSRGYDFLSETLAPPRSRGQKLLLVSGNMWFAKPGLRKPVPVARRQRLVGQAAYGDIAATNYADEYAATVVGEEPVDGEPCVLFDLAAREKNTTYDRIRYWVSRTRGVGIKGEYYTVSGKLIKTARMEYEPVAERDGRRRLFISSIVITDALIAENVTTLSFRNPVFGELPDHIFSVDMLDR